MPNKYHPLATVVLNADSSYSHPAELPIVLHWEDPALMAMNDLKIANAITIDPEASITEAELEMRVCHSHLLLVVDQEQKVRGLLASEDLLGELPLKIAQERKFKRAQIPVKLIMTPREKVVALTLKEVSHAKVGHIIETLHQAHQHYALVVEEVAGSSQQLVRGIFSLHQISKRLGEDVTSDLMEAKSLYELHKRID